MKNTIDDDGDILDEPYYSDIDDFGDETKDDRKWRNPDTDLSRKALAICGRSYFKSKDERSRWKMIEKSAVSLDMGIVSMYPLEWIENIFTWAKNKNKIQVVIKFPAMLSAIQNKESITDFISDWRKELKNNPIEIKPKDFKLEKYE